MKPLTKSLIASGLVLVSGAGLFAQKSDLVTPQKRDETVALAAKLLTPRELAALPASPVVPFNPPGFEQPDPEELKALLAAAAAANASNTPVRAAGDRGILESLAERLAPSGTAEIGGESILLFGQKRLKVGDRLTITFEGVDYDLDITAIGRTTFTLRLNREEITRPIKPGKKS
jgi:hypothetical protein